MGCRKLLAALLLFAGTCFAQNQDILLPAIASPYQVLTANTAWVNLNANYVFTPVTTDSTVCVFITNNNPTSAHSVTLSLQQTGDQSVVSFANQQFKWAGVPITGVTFPASIPANSTVSFFFRSSSAARLALILTGATTQAGSPDTANINAVQPSTSSYCGSAGLAGSIVIAVGPTPITNTIPAGLQSPVQVGGEGVIGASYNGAAYVLGIDPVSKGVSVGSNASLAENSSPPTGMAPNSYNNGSTFVGTFYTTGIGKATDIDWGAGAGDTAGIQRVSRKYGTATSSTFAWASTFSSNNLPLATFQSQADSVNPAAGALLLSVTAGAITSGIGLYRATLSCSAACDMIINRVTTAGTTCTAVTPTQTWDKVTHAAGPATTNVSNKGSCAANPTVGAQLHHVWLSAGVPFVYDLSGYYFESAVATGNGFDVTEGAVLTGTASVTLEWMERQ